MIQIRNISPRTLLNTSLRAPLKAFPPLDVALKAFNLMSNAVVVFYGLKEVVLDRLSIAPLKTKDSKKYGLLQRIFFKALAMIHNPVYSTKEKIALVAHGAFYVLSGVTGFISELPRFIKTGASRKLQMLSVSAFFAGNLIYFASYLRKLIAARKDKTSQGKKLQIKALLGVLNTLSYMAVSAITFFNIPGYFALGFAAFGVLTGTTKIVLDTIS